MVARNKLSDIVSSQIGCPTLRAVLAGLMNCRSAPSTLVLNPGGPLPDHDTAKPPEQVSH